MDATDIGRRDHVPVATRGCQMLHRLYLPILLCLAAGVAACQPGGPGSPFSSASAPSSFASADVMPHRGPEEAEGAIIWLHGWCPGTEDCSTAPTPRHIRAFGYRGWDIYRKNIPPSRANHDDVGWRSRTRLYADLTLPHVGALRAQGYQRVVLAGYSGGAMGVLSAGTREADVDAIIAVAPCCGVNPNGPYTDVSGFYGLLEDLVAPRVMIFFFDGERNAPDNIGRRAKDILTARGIDHVVYDQPPGFVGHGAGYSQNFASEFSDEMIAFARGE